MPNEPKDPYLLLLDRQIKALSKLEETYIGCRVGATGHRWKQVQPDWEESSKGVVPMAKQCENCSAVVRYSVSARYGEYLSKPRYDYPDSYLITEIGERIRPQAVRAEWARRMREAVLPPIMTHPTI